MGAKNFNQTLFCNMIKIGTHEIKWSQLQQFWGNEGRFHAPRRQNM
jgi:hypothetical protein